MIRLLADENFDNDILRGIWKRVPTVDIVRVQDTEIFQAEDPMVLEWAAKEGRILLTHDVKTMTKYANERMAEGLPMPGIFEVSNSVPIGVAIDSLVLAIQAGDDNEWEWQIRYIPFI